MQEIKAQISELSELINSKNLSLDEIDMKIKTIKTKINKEKDLTKQKYIQEAGINLKRTQVLINNPNIVQNDAQTKTISTTIGQKCYVCKNRYFISVDRTMHHFYHALCPKCAEFNYEKRVQTADLTGKIAVVTGGRIKIGYETCLKLLRANCTVICTTRFPTDAFKRYSSESDFEKFKQRLTIWPLDLLNITAIEQFVEFVKSTYLKDGVKLDILINNAAQTIHKPNEYYQTLLRTSKDLIFSNHFPDMVDENGIQVDLRPKNTWVTRLIETNESELLATMLINYVAPFLLLKHFKSYMNFNSFVINVSSMEGKFTTPEAMKTDRHVHNNCAKAAMNMITRSIANRWKLDNIYVNSVETGWITDEMPQDTKSDNKIFYPPLDEIDGAARVLDPIFTTINQNAKDPVYGIFLKDYYRTSW